MLFCLVHLNSKKQCSPPLHNLKSLDCQQRTVTLSKEKQQVIFEEVIAANVHGVSIKMKIQRLYHVDHFSLRGYCD